MHDSVEEVDLPIPDFACNRGALDPSTGHGNER